jgi:murein DD-endopeptidase MepM/ murein hydrolase activator NlpD
VSKFGISKLSLIAIGATIFTCFICYKAYEPNAYEVYMNGKRIAYVDKVESVETLNQNLIEEIKGRFGNVDIKSTIVYEKITAGKDSISSTEDIKNNIAKVVNTKVPAVEMIVDGKSIGWLANEKEGEAVINSIAGHYLSKINIENKKYVGVKNKITYKAGELLITSVNSVEEIVHNVLKLNDEREKPFLTLEFTGSRIESAPINYATTIKWTDTLKTGQSKVEIKGKNGTKSLEKKVTFLNEKESGAKVVKENILEKATNEVVLKGSKEEAKEALAMYVPSRGSVSSNFGMRWGRMHEGIDIAATIGTPIYAALDGKVTFAGWQSGYGYVIELTHDNKIETVYGHCSKIEVKVNDTVKKGEVIGKTGNTGRSTGPHLHFEVRVNGKPQDPAPYIYSKQ